jgi:hypothetical protein
VNNFAHIKPLFKTNKVAYYSIVIEGETLSLYEQFVINHTADNRKKLNHIQAWLKIIGEKYGAQKRFFRNEAKGADTSALPPKGKDKKPSYVEHGKNKSNNLRLYTLRANENVVFLFSGDIKTTDKAQDCPNVKPHFILANQLTKAIDQAFRNREIKWSEDVKTIAFDNNFKLDIS